jgi:hypothetical protein
MKLVADPESRARNIRPLYEFFTKFNVFIYAMNRIANLGDGRSVFAGGFAKLPPSVARLGLGVGSPRWFTVTARAICS